MEFRRRAITVGITFFLAAATGHLMQNADSIAALLRGDPQPVSQVLTGVEPTVGALVPAAASTIVSLPDDISAQPMTVHADLSQIIPDLPAAEPVAFSDETFLAKRIKMLGDDDPSPVAGSDGGPVVFGFSCADSTLHVEAQDGALLHVVLSAPCRPNQRVVFQHSGLSFASMTDAAGTVDLVLPALSQDGEVTAVLAGAAPVTGRDIVVDLDNVTRIAVQAGRVPGLHIQAAPTQGGFLTALGDPSLTDPLLAEVYSVPKGIRSAAPQLEATVMAANCGRTISALGFRTANGAPPESMLIRLAMPGCDGLNDVVVMPLDPVAAAQLASAN